jgi:hypothetical protein
MLAGFRIFASLSLLILLSAPAAFADPGSKVKIVVTPEARAAAADIF